MPDDKLTVQDFAQRIKEKYPEYKDVDDSLLTSRIIEKYPEYKDMVNYSVTPTTPPNVIKAEPFNVRDLATYKPNTSERQPVAIPRIYSNREGLPTVADDNDVTIKTALNSKQSDEAIDKLSMDTFLKGVEKPADQHSETQPIPKPDFKLPPEQLKAQREAFKEVVNPVGDQAKAVLTEAKRISKDKNYVTKINDAFADKDWGSQLTPETRAKIHTGEYGYDLLKKRPTIELKPAEAFVDEVEKHYDDVQKADFLTSASKDEIIANEEKGRAEFDPNKPIPVSKGWASSIAGLAGENITALTKAGASLVAAGTAEVATGFTATPLLTPALGAVFMSHDAGKQAMSRTFTAVYNEMRNNGKDVSESYEEAMKQAQFNGASAAAQMLAMGYFGIKGGKAKLGGAVYGEGLTKFIKSQVPNVTKTFKNIAKEGGVIGTGVGAAKALENLYAGKPWDEDVAQTALGAGAFVGVLHILGAIPQTLKPKGKTVLMNGLAHTDPEFVESGIKQAVVQQALTPEQAQKLREDLAAQRELNKNLKENVPEEHKQKIKDLIDRRTELENSIDPDHPSFVDQAYHKDIKEEINGVKKEKSDGTTEGKDGINEKIRKLSEAPKETPNFHEDELFKKPTVEELIKDQPQQIQNMYKSDPEGFLKFISDQAHEGTMLGDKFISSRPATENQFGKELVDMAVEKYPEHSINEKPRHTISTPEITNVKVKETVEPPKAEPISETPAKETVNPEETKLVVERDGKLKEAAKSASNIERVPVKELSKGVSSDEFIARRAKQDDIVMRQKELKKLIECLW